MIFAVPILLALADPSPAPKPAPSPYPLEALLDKPLTAGGVALLVSHVADPRAARAVADALSHDDAVAREAAARVAGATGLASAGPAVWAALAKEGDRRAAAEMIQAAVALTPPGRDAELIPIAAKLGLVSALADVVAGARGPGALAMLEPLDTAGLGASSVRDFVALATRWGREGLTAAGAAALRQKDAVVWDAVLTLAREPDVVFAPGLLVASVGSSAAPVRAQTYWHLAVTTARGQELPADLEAAIARTAEGEGRPDADVGAAFALTALRRAQKGKTDGPDWAERLAARPAQSLPVDVHGHPAPIRRLLTKAEARALSRKLTAGASDEMFEEESAVDDRQIVTRRMIAAGVTGPLARRILEATGCVPKPGLRAAALVEHRPDGRPRRVSIADLPDSTACAHAAIPLLALSRPPKVVVPSAPRTPLIVTMDPDAIACAETASPRGIEPAVREELGEASPPAPAPKLTGPKKTRTVNPVYPKAARAEGLMGLVLLVGVISETGCIPSMEVVRSAAPALDAAALEAVGGWRYKPATRNGEPIPVYMTISVNFRLGY